MDDIRAWVTKLEAEAEAKWKAKIEQEAAREAGLCRGWVDRILFQFAATPEGRMIRNAFLSVETIGKVLVFRNDPTRVYFHHRSWEEVECDVTVERVLTAIGRTTDSVEVSFCWKSDMEQLARYLVDLDRREQKWRLAE